MHRPGFRLLLALLGLCLGGLVMGSAVGVAVAAGPTQPIAVGSTTLSNIAINGVPGTYLAVAPGANVTISANWSVNDTGCTGCVDFVPAAFQGAASPPGCIENFGQYFSYNSGSGSVNLGAAPTTPGTYNIVAELEEEFSCGPGWDPAGGVLIGQVVVLPSVIPLPGSPNCYGATIKYIEQPLSQQGSYPLFISALQSYLNSHNPPIPLGHGVGSIADQWCKYGPGATALI